MPGRGEFLILLAVLLGIPELRAAPSAPDGEGLLRELRRRLEESADRPSRREAELEAAWRKLPDAQEIDLGSIFPFWRDSVVHASVLSEGRVGIPATLLEDDFAPPVLPESLARSLRVDFLPSSNLMRLTWTAGSDFGVVEGRVFTGLVPGRKDLLAVAMVRSWLEASGRAGRMDLDFDAPLAPLEAAFHLFRLPHLACRKGRLLLRFAPPESGALTRAGLRFVEPGGRPITDPAI